ncbi:hypothetical protein M4951_02075 [Blastopirellula sp. J2-11]|uniref:hypothetical protein n=1 Tax=Blastopirellula sp. J2-11 TaxID=2943192 RepID=UPI0021C82848|nr:hypothetical protein [Blastopirellula sp. J2-11]UUO07108.1 hypothetical protein M4951_02075 [Blastopirellula sp. J2-11]
MKTRGTWLVAAILLLAATIAGLNLAYHWSRTREAITYFGPDDVVLIRSAKQVQLVRQIDGNEQRRDISHVADLDDLQKALVEDASYRFPGVDSPCEPDWPIALEFHQDGKTCTIAIDLDCGQIKSAGRENGLDAAPIQDGLREFIDYAVSRSTPILVTDGSE